MCSSIWGRDSPVYKLLAEAVLSLAPTGLFLFFT